MSDEINFKEFEELYNKCALSDEIEDFERNDCTVLALSQAFDIPYIDAHNWCKAYGRQDREGFHVTAKLMEHIKERLILHTQFIGARFSKVLTYLSKDKVYLVTIRGHMFCVKNGTAMDGQDNSRKTCERVWEVK